ncbi:MAG TPA: beta-ketoacyl-ACP synthase II [Anaerolineae bacterium]|jgi:3-oxoacyl-[acyl-carrier-protein] synthase II|nr:beta-ketoacyl-ACP synthase II [Anaerolineae bacterium]
MNPQMEIQPNNTTRQSRDHLQRSRVVITGLGAITPLGNTVSETWEGLVAGRSGANRITIVDPTNYPCKVNAELKGFDPERFIPRNKCRRMPMAAQIAVIASDQAIEHARLDLASVDRDRVGVIIGTAGGSTMEETERATRQLDNGKGRLTPFQVLRFWANMPSFYVSENHGLRGYNSTVCTACAAGTQAIGEAARVIERGDADIMLTGGTEHLATETVLAGFVAMRAMATSYNDDPARAMRPFDANREGFIAGLGCAVLVLERLEHAQARGAPIYAEVLGSGASNDAFHLIAPDPDGAGAALAMKRALDDAGINITDVDYINAHGTSTPAGDVAETKAIKTVFGENAYDIPVSSSKSMVGHMMGAAGAVEAVACIMTLNEGIIHPTINYETPDPECDLDYVPNLARKADVKIALSNSFGLGGQNACVVLGRVNGLG